MADLTGRLVARAAQEGLAVSAELSVRLLAYFDLLQRWNKKINLTSISDEDEALDRLLLEPLAAAVHLPHGGRLADLGSGGGSPAIPLALSLGAPEVLMVESRSRKAAFLREAAREIALNAVVESARFEEVSRRSKYSGGFDVISIRAVRPDAATLSAATKLLKPQGLVALFEGPHAAEVALPRSDDLSWRATAPLLRSTGSQLVLMFHVEHQ